MIPPKISISAFPTKAKLQDLLRENRERLQVSYASLTAIIAEGSSKDHFDTARLLLLTRDKDLTLKSHVNSVSSRRLILH